MGHLIRKNVTEAEGWLPQKLTLSVTVTAQCQARVLPRTQIAFGGADCSTAEGKHVESLHLR